MAAQEISKGVEGQMDVLLLSLLSLLFFLVTWQGEAASVLGSAGYTQ